SGAGDENALSWLDLGLRQRVQGHGEGLDQDGRTQRHAVFGDTDELGGGGEHVAGEGAVAVAAGDRAPTLAQRDPAPAAGAALAAASWRPADDGVARRPAVDAAAGCRHPPRPLVAADASRLSPPVEHHVQVAAAHAAPTD